MAEVSRDIIDDNMLGDSITVITGRIEDVSLPCNVDIIVSEWMGFYLVHESMMRSVLIARDRFLKPGGIIIPESAEIYCAPANCDNDVMANISWCRTPRMLLSRAHDCFNFSWSMSCD
jgi:protein arginine N-methyltransferase 1